MLTLSTPNNRRMDVHDYILILDCRGFEDFESYSFAFFCSSGFVSFSHFKLLRTILYLAVWDIGTSAYYVRHQKWMEDWRWCFHCCLSVCLLVCPFVCLFVCLSPTGHNSKPIVMKLHQVVEIVSTEKPIDVEVKFLKLSFFIRLTWNLNKICMLRHWIGKPTFFFFFFRWKGQLKYKLLKSIFFWKSQFSPSWLEN